MFYTKNVLLLKNSLLVKDDEARNVILVLLFDDGVEPCGSPPFDKCFSA